MVVFLRSLRQKRTGKNNLAVTADVFLGPGGIGGFPGHLKGSASSPVFNDQFSRRTTETVSQVELKVNLWRTTGNFVSSAGGGKRRLLTGGHVSMESFYWGAGVDAYPTLKGICFLSFKTYPVSIKPRA